jgi:hypothetical protein
MEPRHEGLGVPGVLLALPQGIHLDPEGKPEPPPTGVVTEGEYELDDDGREIRDDWPPWWGRDEW